MSDRELTVIKFMSSNTSLKQVNMFLAARDKAEEEKQQTKVETINTDKPQGILVGSKFDITEDDDIAAAVKLIAENEKNSQFRDKRSIELEKVQKQAHHTRTKIRVKFPDTYIMQGTFGAKERVCDVYEFVRQHLATPDRAFYLFETPPKKVHKNSTVTLITSKLVPSCLLYFAWEDVEETKMEHGPFMDMHKVKDKIILV